MSVSRTTCWPVNSILSSSLSFRNRVANREYLLVQVQPESNSSRLWCKEHWLQRDMPTGNRLPKGSTLRLDLFDSGGGALWFGGFI